MRHCDPEVLALRALGEPAGDASDDRHLSGCGHCRAELDQLIAVVATARQVDDADRPVPAPPDVWTRVATETGEGATAAGVRPPTDDAVGPGADTPAEAAVVTTMPRRRTRLLTAAAAVAGVLVGGIGVALWERPGTPAAEQVVAQATLAPLAGSDATGAATVLAGEAGGVVTVDVRGLPTTDGYYEVWLLDPTATKLVPLGTLAPGQPARYVLPAGVSLTDYPVVDVSLEPLDGDPAHSADSKLRGTLNA